MSDLTNNHLMYGSTTFAKHIKYLILAILLIAILTISTSVSAQYTEIKRLGTTQAICPKPGAQSVSELQRFFVNNRSLVEAILKDANWQGSTQLLFDVVADGEVSERQYDPGTTFEWMGLRDKGTPKAMQNRVWVGDEAFEGFEVVVTQSCKTHTIVIPKVCCNLSLASTETVVDTPTLKMEVSGQNLSVCSQPDATVSLKTANETQILPLNDSACWVGKNMPIGVYTASAKTECGAIEKSAQIAKNDSDNPDGKDGISDNYFYGTGIRYKF